MNFDNEKELERELLKKDPLFLPRAKKIGFICPNCGNGSGTEGTGIQVTRDTKGTDHPRYKCFKCGINEDVIGLYMLSAGISDMRTAKLELLKNFFSFQ